MPKLKFSREVYYNNKKGSVVTAKTIEQLHARRRRVRVEKTLMRDSKSIKGPLITKNAVDEGLNGTGREMLTGLFCQNQGIQIVVKGLKKKQYLSFAMCNENVLPF